MHSLLLQERVDQTEKVLLSEVTQTIAFTVRLGIVQCSINSSDGDDVWMETDPKLFGNLFMEAFHRPGSIIITRTTNRGTLPSQKEMLLFWLERFMENIGLSVRIRSVFHDFSSTRFHFEIGESLSSKKGVLLVVFQTETFLSFAFFARNP